MYSHSAFDESFFLIWNANHQIDNSHLIWRKWFMMREHNTDKRDLRKLDCPELSFRKRCCTYVNTGHWRKIHQDTGLCVLCIRYVCVRVRLRVCVCVRVCPRLSFGMRKIYARLQYENSFSCPLYSLWCETKAQYPSEWDYYREWSKQDKEIDFGDSVASPHRELI